jgi:hypothetical protein
LNCFSGTLAVVKGVTGRDRADLLRTGARTAKKDSKTRQTARDGYKDREIENERQERKWREEKEVEVEGRPE